MQYPPRVYPDRPQDSLEEAIYKIAFLAEALTQPINPQERFSISDDAQVGLSLIFTEVKDQLRASSDALIAKMAQRKQEV